jgi:hypothetical protein
MENFISELPAIERSVGAPWLWQVRAFEDDCVAILREIRGLRLQSGRYPTRQEHQATCCCDSSILQELIQSWDQDWQVSYIVIRIAACGLYTHPDTADLTVRGVPVAGQVEEVLQLVARRGYADGVRDAAMHGRFEAPWVGEVVNPLQALQEMTGELDEMARTIMRECMDEP